MPDIASEQAAPQQQQEEERPEPQDIIDTLIEQLTDKDNQIRFVTDQMMFFKAQAKKFKRERDFLSSDHEQIDAPVLSSVPSEGKPSKRASAKAPAD